MTETPPEAPIPDDELGLDNPPDPPPAAAFQEPEEEEFGDADGVAPDRLTGVAFYDTLELRYVGGVHATKAKARKGEDFTEDDRFVLRRV